MPIVGDNLDEAAGRLRAGQAVVFATETVYGLGADAARPEAVAEVYRLKGRPANHPVIVHLADFSFVADWAEIVPDSARLLAQTYWPGALTLLLPRRRPLPAPVAGDSDYIGLRAPSHPVAQKLLRIFGKPIAAPSANLFGRLSATTAAAAAAQFAREKNLYIVDGGACKMGIESTIVQCAPEAVYLLRPGAVAAEDIERTLGMPLRPPPAAVAAPGLLPRHYSPHTPLLTTDKKMLSARLKEFTTAAVLSARCPLAVPARRWRRAAAHPREYARRLYELLRQLDGEGAEVILVENPPPTPPWRAVRDRLRRAAANEETI